MAVLSNEQIADIFTTNPREDDLKEIIRLQNSHKVHVNGDNYISVITDLIGSENAKEYAVKRQSEITGEFNSRELAKPVTMSICQEIFDDVDRWTNSDGTVKSYDLGKNDKYLKEFKSVLKTVWKGGSIDLFVHQFLREAIRTDFGGFLVVEMARPYLNEDLKETGFQIKDGRIVPDNKITGKRDPYIIFIKASEVYAYENSGAKTEYLIYKYSEHVITEKDDNGIESKRTVTVYRVIDDEKDDLWWSPSGTYEPFREDGNNEIYHGVGYAPTVQVSIRSKDAINSNVRTSPIHEIIPLLDRYLSKDADHFMTEKKHANPILALMGVKCQYKETIEGSTYSCDGGTLLQPGGQEKVCPRCDGYGATVPKSHGEIIVLPQLDKSGKAFDPSMVGTYIYPPVEVLKYQEESLENLRQRILFVGTGIKYLEKKVIKTATEITVNLKPLEDKISNTLDLIEYVEIFITNVIGDYFNRIMLNGGYSGCEISYGRILNVKDENTIVTEIEAAKKSGAPLGYIKSLQNSLVKAKFRNSPLKLERNTILIDLEPLPSFTIQEVLTMDGTLISDAKRRLKINFLDYIERFEEENGKITNFKKELPIKDRIELIRQQIIKYDEEESDKIKLNIKKEDNDGKK